MYIFVLIILFNRFDAISTVKKRGKEKKQVGQFIDLSSQISQFSVKFSRFIKSI